MKISTIVENNTEPLGLEATLFDAKEAILRHKKGANVFIDDGKAIAIITERDIINLFNDEINFQNRAIDYASKDLITTEENRDVLHVLDLMSKNSIRRVVVTNMDGEYRGFLTHDDLVNTLQKEINSQKIVAEHFLKEKRDVITQYIDTTLKEALSVMCQNRISVLPILSKDENIEGVLLESEIVSKIGSATLDTPISSLISKKFIRAKARDSIDELLNLLEINSCNYALVLEGRKIEGIITKRDILNELNKNINDSVSNAIFTTKSVLNSFPQAVVEFFVQDEQISFQWANKEAKRIFGENILSKKFDDIFSKNHKKLKGLLKSGEIKDNTYIEHNDRFYSITFDEGKDNIISAIFVDITAEKRYKILLEKTNRDLEEIIQERTKDLIETNIKLDRSKRDLENAQRITKLGSFSFDTQESKIYTSKELIKILALKEGDVTLKSILKKISKHDLKNLTILFRNLTKDNNLMSREAHLKEMGEEEKIVRFSVEVFFDKNGFITKIDGTCQDISDIIMLEERAYYDDLTKIYNRNKLNELLNREIELLKRYEMPVSLIMFDIDRFKKINDNYGHLIGDKVLIDLASVVNNSIRNTDIFARWGGEEFMIVAPHTSLLGGVELSEKIRENLSAYSFEEAGKITCSFGVIELKKSADIQDEIKRCDDLLYKAKELGRDRVEHE